jgi:integrase
VASQTTCDRSTAASTFRRSELAALTLEDVLFTSRGLVVRVRRGKTDQEQKGEVKEIPFGEHDSTCPVRALRSWVMAARLEQGSLFRRCDRQGRATAAPLSAEAVADVVKRAVRRRGLREGWTRAERDAAADAVAGHSLRSGFVSAAARNGASEWQIMQHTGHRSVSTLRRYIRLSAAFDSPVAGKVGL